MNSTELIKVSSMRILLTYVIFFTYFFDYNHRRYESMVLFKISIGGACMTIGTGAEKFLPLSLLSSVSWFPNQVNKINDDLS